MSKENGLCSSTLAEPKDSTQGDCVFKNIMSGDVREQLNYLCVVVPKQQCSLLHHCRSREVPRSDLDVHVPCLWDLLSSCSTTPVSLNLSYLLYRLLTESDTCLHWRYVIAIVLQWRRKHLPKVVSRGSFENLPPWHRRQWFGWRVGVDEVRQGRTFLAISS